MQSVNPNPIDITHDAIDKKKSDLEGRIKSGVDWFFWIAGLSIINSIVFLFGGSFMFIFGLGVTQLVDAITSSLADEGGPVIGLILRVFGFGIDTIIAAIFIVCGFLGRKRLLWAVIVGIALYAFDLLMLLIVGDWVGILFHAWALWCLIRGAKAIIDLAELEKSRPGTGSLFNPNTDQAGGEKPHLS
jgi:hypothetical protein